MLIPSALTPQYPSTPLRFLRSNQIIIFRIMQSHIHRNLLDLREADLLQRADHRAHREHPSMEVEIFGFIRFVFPKEMLIDGIQIITGQQAPRDGFDILRRDAQESFRHQNPMKLPEDMEIVAFAEMLQCRGGENFRDHAVINREAFLEVEDEIDFW